MTHDSRGLLDSVSGPHLQTTSYTRDDLGRVLSESRAGGAATSLAYDAGRSAPCGVTLSYGYDGHLLASVAWNGPFSAGVGFDCDNDVRPVTERVNAANPTTFTYDDDGLVSQAGVTVVAHDAQWGPMARRRSASSQLRTPMIRMASLRATRCRSQGARSARRPASRMRSPASCRRVRPLAARLRTTATPTTLPGGVLAVWA
jgi:YD repeat-containing protein